jgi:hypothetical protein
VGYWDVSLYAGDFAMDLRAAVASVAKLPFEGDRLLEIICETESAVASNPADEDYATFWLVVADQFARRGIVAARAREMALQIIDGGLDLDTQARLAQSATGLARRSRMLEQIRERIAHPAPTPPRRQVLREPERFVMDVGEALVYPVCDRKPLNPYVAQRQKQISYAPGGPQPWVQDAWGAMIVAERGRAFGFYAWYRPLVILHPRLQKPEEASIADEDLRLQLPGNCPRSQFQRMGLESVGRFDIDPVRFQETFHGLRPGDRYAIADISIGNRLSLPHPDRKAVSRAPYDAVIRIGALVRRSIS